MRQARWVKAIAVAVMLSLPGLAAAEGFYASQQSKKYHAEQCRSVKKIKADKLQVFATKAEAEAAGYKACKRCKP